MRAVRNGVSLTTNYVTVMVKPKQCHIVNSYQLTKFDGGLRLHEADEAAVNWLTTLWLQAYDNNNQMFNYFSRFLTLLVLSLRYRLKPGFYYTRVHGPSLRA